MKSLEKMIIRKLNQENLEKIKNINNNNNLKEDYSQLENGIDICAHCGKMVSKIIEKPSPIDPNKNVKAIKCFHCGSSTKDYDSQLENIDVIIKNAWKNKIDINLTNLTSLTNLVPCPKCGSMDIETVITFDENNKEEFFRKSCMKCNYNGPIGLKSLNNHSEENLIRLWNTRTICFEKMIPVSWLNGKFIKLNSRYNHRIISLNAIKNKEINFKIDSNNTIAYFRQFLFKSINLTTCNLMCKINLNFPITGINIFFFNTNESQNDYILEFKKHHNLIKKFVIHSTDKSFNKNMIKLIKIFFDKLYINSNSLSNFFKDLKSATSRNFLNEI